METYELIIRTTMKELYEKVFDCNVNSFLEYLNLELLSPEHVLRMAENDLLPREVAAIALVQ